MTTEVDAAGKMLESGVLGAVTVMSIYVAYRIGVAYKTLSEKHQEYTKAQTEKHQAAMETAYRDYLSRMEKAQAESDRIHSEMATAAREERQKLVESLDRNTHAFNELFRIIEKRQCFRDEKA